MTKPSALQRAFFWSGAVLPLPSILLYVLSPGGTVQHFNGQISTTAKFWCSLTASGDAVMSFLCFYALFTSNDGSAASAAAAIRKLVVRAMLVYSYFHFGAFWYWHLHGDPHPAPLMYPMSLLVSTAAALAWGR